jgi:hypothetical protein
MAEGPLKVVRDRLLPGVLSIGAVQRKFTTFLIEDSINYRKGPLSDGSRRGSVCSGDNWPLSAGAEAELLLPSDVDRATAPATFGGPNGFPLTVTSLAAADPRSLRLSNHRAAILVRPDGIVASVGSDMDAIVSWKERI